MPVLIRLRSRANATFYQARVFVTQRGGQGAGSRLAARYDLLTSRGRQKKKKRFKGDAPRRSFVIRGKSRGRTGLRHVRHDTSGIIARSRM